ncbi:alpha/beta fold hydrolase [Rhodanobacter aciditrophus]|uniref:Alpha/beta fold hydrolase n=1 Tax=Rhodanobacter aciditrophus TaxID=1623218 RepID=A0ABW4B5B9_9GAMM
MIHAKQYGSDKPALVVLHGLFGNADNWHSLAQKWQEDFTVYCLDLPNHGKSSNLSPVSYKKMAAEINSWMEEQSLENIFLLGHSMGGKVAMQLTHDFPEKIKKLIVADIAPVDYQASHLEIFKGLTEINEQHPHSRKEADQILAPHEENMGVRQFLLKNLQRGDEGFYIHLGLEELKEGYDSILAKPEIDKATDTSTLFIKGEHSPYIQAKFQEQTLALFPNASVKMIPDTGHWLHAEKPVPFAGLVKRFLTT